ncbi:prokineticin-1 isoform X2 [Lepidochelys kempii]|uniref:prokineticin-1 isoform X2 n=1 Tax=Lepidochelys kempii TaxID=8472 RepID=UPI003C6EB5B4
MEEFKYLGVLFRSNGKREHEIDRRMGVAVRQACERDLQCGAGTCCAISLWLRGLRMCTPLGQEGDECHPFSHKVPFLGKRQHHTCPCLPNFICSRFIDGRFRCSVDFKNIDF